MVVEVCHKASLPGRTCGGRGSKTHSTRAGSDDVRVVVTPSTPSSGTQVKDPFSAQVKPQWVDHALGVGCMDELVS